MARFDEAGELRIVLRVHSFSYDDQRYVCVNVQDAGSKVGHTSGLAVRLA